MTCIYDDARRPAGKLIMCPVPCAMFMKKWNGGSQRKLFVDVCSALLYQKRVPYTTAVSHVVVSRTVLTFSDNILLRNKHAYAIVSARNHKCTYECKVFVLCSYAYDELDTHITKYIYEKSTCSGAVSCYEQRKWSFKLSAEKLRRKRQRQSFTSAVVVCVCK